MSRFDIIISRLCVIMLVPPAWFTDYRSRLASTLNMFVSGWYRKSSIKVKNFKNSVFHSFNKLTTISDVRKNYKKAIFFCIVHKIVYHACINIIDIDAGTKLTSYIQHFLQNINYKTISIYWNKKTYRGIFAE